MCDVCYDDLFRCCHIKNSDVHRLVVDGRAVLRKYSRGTVHIVDLARLTHALLLQLLGHAMPLVSFVFGGVSFRV